MGKRKAPKFFMCFICFSALRKYIGVLAGIVWCIRMVFKADLLDGHMVKSIFLANSNIFVPIHCITKKNFFFKITIHSQFSIFFFIKNNFSFNIFLPKKTNNFPFDSFDFSGVHWIQNTHKVQRFRFDLLASNPKK